MGARKHGQEGAIAPPSLVEGDKKSEEASAHLENFLPAPLHISILQL